MGEKRTTRKRAKLAPARPNATGASQPRWGHACARAISASRPVSAAIKQYRNAPPTNPTSTPVSMLAAEIRITREFKSFSSGGQYLLTFLYRTDITHQK